jgi:hypothetical protein
MHSLPGEVRGRADNVLDPDPRHAWRALVPPTDEMLHKQAENVGESLERPKEVAYINVQRIRSEQY